MLIYFPRAKNSHRKKHRTFQELKLIETMPQNFLQHFASHKRISFRINEKTCLVSNK